MVEMKIEICLGGLLNVVGAMQSAAKPALQCSARRARTAAARSA